MNYFDSAEIDSDPIFIDFKDITKISIRDIPENVNFEIVEIIEPNHHSIKLEGVFTYRDDKMNIHMYHNWYRKYWDYPMGLSH